MCGFLCGRRIYNDHHFQFGFLLYACAALGRLDGAWLASQQASILAVVRDYANPRRDDPFFPYARHMDW